MIKVLFPAQAALNDICPLCGGNKEAYPYRSDGPFIFIRCIYNCYP